MKYFKNCVICKVPQQQCPTWPPYQSVGRTVGSTLLLEYHSYHPGGTHAVLLLSSALLSHQACFALVDNPLANWLLQLLVKKLQGILHLGHHQIHIAAAQCWSQDALLVHLLGLLP